LGSCHACAGALADFLSLLLCHRGQDGKQNIAHKLVVGRKMRLGVAMESDAARIEALQILNRCLHAFAGKPVERPKQHAIKAPFVSIIEQGGKLLASLGALPAAFVVNVLVYDLVPCVGAPSS
jgi:hypothetical protein